MARDNRRRESPIKNLIKESINEMNNGEFPEDPRLDAEQLSGPERFVKGQKHKDEIVIDSLLADIQGKAGYFLKLKKEVRPNEYMLMKVIESDWRRWADIETEVANIVKEHTKVAPQKWGTGSYRVELACKGGMRGKGYDPIDFFINAEEEFNPQQNGNVGQINQQINPEVAVASRIEELSNLVNMLSGVMPKPQDPSTIQNQIAQAFQQGMALKSNESSNSTQMMTALMTGMMGMLTTVLQNKNEPRIVNPEDTMSKMLTVMKDFGVLGNKSTQEKTAIDFAKELQALGLDLFKKEEPLEQINKLKQLANIAGQFMGINGEGEKPSILEKLIDSLGPSIPTIIGNIKETVEKASQAQILAGQNLEKARMLGSRPQQRIVQNNVREEPTTFQTLNNQSKQETTVQQTEIQQEEVNNQTRMFFKQLYENIKMGNRTFYPIIYTSLMQDQNGVDLVNGIFNGTKNTKDLIHLLQQYGGEKFKESDFVMKYLVGYVNGFIMWVKQLNNSNESTIEQEQEVNNTGYDVVCNVCKTVYSYESKEDYDNDENKQCEVEACPGIIKVIEKVAS
jgi:hypothetical protein